MSMDYYDLLGVDPDAEVSDIRAAYRERKAEVADRTDDDAKADAAALNKAWNVLSDPYQRDRYDQSRAGGGDEEETDDDDVVDVPATRSRTRTTRTNPRADARKGARPAPQPTISLPAGMQFATPKQRFIAMAIDLLVLIALFVGSFLLTDSIERSKHPGAHHVVAVYADKSDAVNKAIDKAKKTASANVDCTKKPTAENDKAYCDAQDQKTKLKKEYDDAQKTLAPTRSLISGLFFLVALLVLLVPSLFGGRTLGKRLQGVRIAKLDGSRVGAAEVFRRYGALALGAFALYSFLGPLGPMIVIFVATLWTRNPNRQGLQDRFARTIVVSDVA